MGLKNFVFKNQKIGHSRQYLLNRIQVNSLLRCLFLLLKGYKNAPRSGIKEAIDGN